MSRISTWENCRLMSCPRSLSSVSGKFKSRYYSVKIHWMECLTSARTVKMQILGNSFWMHGPTLITLLSLSLNSATEAQRWVALGFYPDTNFLVFLPTPASSPTPTGHLPVSSLLIKPPELEQTSQVEDGVPQDCPTSKAGHQPSLSSQLISQLWACLIFVWAYSWRF